MSLKNNYGFITVKPKFKYIYGELILIVTLGYLLHIIIDNYFQNKLFYNIYWDYETLFKYSSFALGFTPTVIRLSKLLKYFLTSSYEFSARGIKLCGVLGLHEDYTEMSKVLDWKSNTFGLFSFVIIETKDSSHPTIVIPYIDLNDKDSIMDFLEKRATSSILEHIQQKTLEKDIDNDKT